MQENDIMKKVSILSLILFLLMICNNSVSGEVVKNSSRNKKISEISYKTGNYYFEKKKYAEVINFFEQAIADGYVNNDIYFKLSICYQEIKKYTESMYYLDKAIQLLENTVDKNI